MTFVPQTVSDQLNAHTSIPGSAWAEDISGLTYLPLCNSGKQPRLFVVLNMRQRTIELKAGVDINKAHLCIRRVSLEEQSIKDFFTSLQQAFTPEATRNNVLDTSEDAR